jgi:hypothetical protein
MKRIGLALAVGLSFGLCGCAQPYVLKLSNGARIVTPSKPKLENGMYRYKDAHGQVNSIPQTRVVEVAPQSIVEEENKFTPPKPEKSHWWKFW